jgi:hypothetical protein
MLRVSGDMEKIVHLSTANTVDTHNVDILTYTTATHVEQTLD